LKDLREITRLVEHPIPVRPPSEPVIEPTVPVILTDEERKKLRRQRRREDRLAKMDRIRFGWEETDDNKLKLSNFMRSKTAEAVQDPTRMEQEVRSQMAERQRVHDETNKSRQLTDEDRRKKNIGKWEEDLRDGIQVAIYRVKDLSDVRKLRKLELNIEQMHMRGCIVRQLDVNAVIVESGM
jgi:U4/U6 small nuclear ribonucleoprotein PRP3